MTKYSIKDAGDLKQYFIQIPNIIDDMGLSLIAFRLYVHLKRVTGEHGTCYQKGETISKACNMSVGAISKAKKELTEKGLITVTPKSNKIIIYHDIVINDIWEMNIKAFKKPEPIDDGVSPSEIPGSPSETPRSPGETKKNPVNKNPEKKRDPSFSKSENESPIVPLQSNEEEQQEQTDYLAKGTNHNLEHDDYPEPEMVEVPGEFEPTLPPPPPAKPAKVAKKSKAKSGRYQQDTPEEIGIIAALADVTNINAKTGHYLLKPAAQNLLADERVCPEVIRRDYGKDGAWYKKHWKGKRGDKPDLFDITKTMLTWGETETGSGAKEISFNTFYK